MEDASKEKVDTKGIAWFLGITFSLTILMAFIMWFKDISLADRPPLIAQLTIAGAMWFPALAAFIVRKFITKEGFGDAGLVWGPGKYYLQVYLLIPLIFVVIYSLTAIFVAKPDFTLTKFAAQYGIKSLPPSPWLIIIGIFLATLTFAPVINSAWAFGEEFGWRGYLLPKLLPLGKVKALFLSGLIWGAWHIPWVLIGFHYGDQKLWGVILFTLIVMLLGVYIGYLRLASGSVFLAAFAHGVFNSQFYGVWQLLFPHVNPVLGGATGLMGVIVILLVASRMLMRIEG